MNIKNYLKEKIDQGVDFWDLPYEIEVNNWPNVDDDGYEEPLDCENFEWLSIEDDELVISCGGDWQDPLTLTLKMNDNDELTVTKTEPGFSSGLSEEDFYEILEIEREEDFDDFEQDLDDEY
jgi:hypothetical protein